MPIQILPARLANQIAAGEVVERPASVVKELVENSLDAGATKIEIDIDKGGSRTIRIRDNGQGIPKDELELALSRHATSKISTLDDLEAIASLGFRGEALASISSVSRLTLTSRTESQPEAWSAYAEGRDMQVQLKPAAHPVGTTLEVLDLFFNTPARRKFLRTEKTEFAHIDELLKRIALSRFDVSILLRHNGKLIRQYRASETQAQKERRLAAVCGQGFLQHAVSLELGHGDLRLSGWICTPQGARAQNDLQYCYVNGRMMKDKLINHAIRQAFEGALAPEQYAAYVLFIEVDPHQVDVNVHPAKHEVRFHHARLVHDFIYQGVQSALQQTVVESDIYTAPERASARSYQVEEPVPAVNAPSQNTDLQPPASDALDAIANTPAYPRQAPAETWFEQTAAASQPAEQEKTGRDAASREHRTSRDMAASAPRPASSRSTSPRQFGNESPSKAEVAAYQALMQTPAQVPSSSDQPKPVSEPAPSVTSGNAWREAPAPVQRGPVQRGPVLNSQPEQGLGKALSVIAGRYLLVTHGDGVALLSLEEAERLRVQGQLRFACKDGLKPQPLLIPLAIPATPALFRSAEQHRAVLNQLGIQLRGKGQDKLVILAVSQPLRQQNLQAVIPALLEQLNVLSEAGDQRSESEYWEALLAWLSVKLAAGSDKFSLSQAITLLGELEQLWGDALETYDSRLLRPVDLQPALEAFQHD
ncbi:DNA mismatch repair endonuclease MutL [Photobacterium galatheae]|uniref:DNA mismatch repair protein MutL n=1 Tax=Photobacterium galatheae TaxID=1654360 RepID=A0A066RRI7_9GAMM|nr:DNA mismatch repair endonuclease MutL [Photobacterium galatheae]KDM90287.1 DNA mismatch repair protein MutL [Photobacterium galatheae]MCM0150831.1 DNA mismatch repair endonuclease MutL [Photobacterium galatheae]